jgi:hypothetical protein
MIKIEKLKDGAKVFITRDGTKCEIYINQLITPSEFNTIEIEGGSCIYSIDENEVKELVGQARQLTLNLAETVQDAVAVVDAVKVEVTPVVATSTIIIKPTRAKK